jgi:2-oxoglutarate dehydrogenase E2 component (dihydrolipoamide succinyltransferase)
MTIEVKVPVLPESVADAVIASWHKAAGDRVRRDETLVDLETDKVILEVPAISDGVITEIRYGQGETASAEQVIALIDDTATADVEVESAAIARTTASAQPAKAATVSDTSTAVSPSARRLLAEHAIDPALVEGSGRHGTVLKEDVLKYIDNARSAASEPAPEKPATAPVRKHVESSRPAQVPTMPDTGERLEKRVPMTRLRARIAERLLQAQQNAAILTTFNEVNMQPVMELRKKYREKFESEFGVKLGFMSFFVKATLEALKKFPAVNASIDGDDIVYHGYYDIGVAVSGPAGLVVPVLRNVEDMSVAQIEKAIIDFAEKAAGNALSIEDITGGTFTISNGGVFGSMLSTPILNPPQSAILGMHSIKQRPMVVDGDIVALPMMYLALSYDHRIIDGREAVQFLVTIRDLLEDPSRMLLGI